jgi:two-component system sensor histidine kinase DesK
MNAQNTMTQQAEKGFRKYGHLMFTGFYLLPLVLEFSHFSAAHIVMALAFYVAFILLYVKALDCEGAGVDKLFVMMLMVSFFATFYNSGTPTLFGFIAYIGGYAYSKKQRVYAALAIMLMVMLSAYMADINHIDAFLAVALIVCAALFSLGITTKREYKHKIREQQTAQQLEQVAAIAERERIARDLHDILGHSLSSIALKAELANKLNQAQRYDQANNEIDQVAELARQLLSDVRNAVSNLKSLNLLSQVKLLEQRLLEHDFDVEFTTDIATLPAKVEGIASLILTEAVTNLLRHSRLKKCTITLNQTASELLISVIDSSPCPRVIAGNGLTGIKERAEQINGSAYFECNEHFTLTVNLPLTEQL